MNRSEFQEFLNKFPADAEVKILVDHKDANAIPFGDESIMLTSSNAHVDSSAPEEEWDCEDGKIIYDGTPVLVINPIII